MESIFTEISTKAGTARKNVDYIHTNYLFATRSGLDDAAFEAVTNPITSEMEKIIITALNVEDRLKVLRDTDPNPNFLRDLDAVDQMADDVLAKSKDTLGIMRKAVADAKERKRARGYEANEEARKKASEEEETRKKTSEEKEEEEARKKARYEPGGSSSYHHYRH